MKRLLESLGKWLFYAFIACIYLVPITFFCVIGFIIVKHAWQAPKEVAGFGLDFIKAYGLLLLSIGAISAVGLTIGAGIYKVGQRYNEKQRWSFYSQVKWITGLAQVFYVPWEGYLPYEETGIHLGYSFLFEPITRDGYDTSLHYFRVILTLVIWGFALYGLKAALYGKEKADLMLEGKYRAGDCEATELQNEIMN